jgi:hypothetical protein
VLSGEFVATPSRGWRRRRAPLVAMLVMAVVALAGLLALR